MPWAYCAECDAEMSYPTFGDAVAGKQECPRCGAEREVGDHERRAVGEDIAERLDRVERAVYGSGYDIPFSSCEE